MLDASNGINSDLSYLESEVSDYFEKIFFHLDQNFSENKEQFREYFIDLMNAIVSNQFDNKEQVLKELKGLSHGEVLAEAVDETDKILNDSSKSRLFIELKQRLIILKGGIIADDDTISGFIKKYSTPYLKELFEEKNVALQELQSSNSQEEEKQVRTPSPSPTTHLADSPIRQQENLVATIMKSFPSLSREECEGIIQDINETKPDVGRKMLNDVKSRTPSVIPITPNITSRNMQ
jgi:hypothetical protein